MIIIIITLILIGAVLLWYRSTHHTMTPTNTTSSKEFVSLDPAQKDSTKVGEIYLLYTTSYYTNGPAFDGYGNSKPIGTGRYYTHKFVVSSKPFNIADTEDESNFNSGKLVRTEFSNMHYHSPNLQENIFTLGDKKYVIKVVEDDNTSDNFTDDLRLTKPFSISVGQHDSSGLSLQENISTHTFVWDSPEAPSPVTGFDYPILEDFEEDILVVSAQVDLQYLKKDKTYAQTPPPITIKSFVLMSGIPKEPIDKELKWVENAYGFKYIPYEKMVEYEKEGKNYDVSISGPSGTFRVVVPNRQEDGFDREKIYNLINTSFRHL